MSFILKSKVGLFMGALAALGGCALVFAQDQGDGAAGEEFSSGAMPVENEGSDTIDPELELLVPELQEDFFQGAFQDSPFTRRMNLPDSVFITGMARVDGTAVVTVIDMSSKEKKTHVLTSQPNKDGWRLVEVSEGDLDWAEVKIQIWGGEIFSARYNPETIQPLANYGPLKKDKYGRAIPPQRIIDKFKTLNKDQMKKYMAWRATMVKKDPSLDKSPRRFPIIEKAVDNIKAGKAPPKQ